MATTLTSGRPGFTTARTLNRLRRRRSPPPGRSLLQGPLDVTGVEEGREARRKLVGTQVAQLDEEGKTIRKKDETEDLKNDEGVVMVESRAAHLAQQEDASGASESDAGGTESDNGDPDVVKLSSGKKKAKKKSSSNGDGLF